MKQQLNAGIIGLGVGEKHIAGYNKHPNCTVTALCDFSTSKLLEIKNKYKNIKTATDSNLILEDPEIDVVSIASYDNYHYEQILKAIENKKHIFVEKPLCLFKKDAEHIYSLLMKHPDLKLSTNVILRKSPRFIMLRKLISNGEMGNLFYVEGDYNYGRLYKITNGWRGEIDFYSIIYGGGIHIVDLLMWLTNDRIIEVAALGTDIVTKNTGFKYNDMVVCIFRFKSGMIGKMAVNFGCVYPHFHLFSIFGTEATFQNTLQKGLFFKTRDQHAEPKIVTENYLGMDKGDLIYNFVDSILYGSKEEVTVQEVFDTMSVCFALEKATYIKEFVPVDYIK